MTKKVVHYNDAHGVVGWRNGSVFLTPVDHPDTLNVSNTRPVMTSTVVSWDKETGIIETLNTIYKPLSKKESE